MPVLKKMNANFYMADLLKLLHGFFFEPVKEYESSRGRIWSPGEEGAKTG
jgi:hypothetical protein